MNEDWKTWVMMTSGFLTILLACMIVRHGFDIDGINARLDAIERTTNVLMQWSAYRAFTNASFTSIERTNAPMLH